MPVIGSRWRSSNPYFSSPQARQVGGLVTLLTMPSFSQRYGYAQPPPITVLEDLPSSLRGPIVEIASRRTGASRLRKIVENVLDPYGTNPQPLSPTANMAALFANAPTDLIAVRERIMACHWYRVYDIVEAFHRELVRQDKQAGFPVEGAPHAPGFEHDINRFFVHSGIGWQLANGEVVRRGDGAFESTMREADAVLIKSGRPTAAGHLKSGRRALSERPNPNTAGAVAHATSSVECVLGEITGESLTLGKYLDRYPRLLHRALSKALDGIYGFASDAGARHGKEGIEPSYEEASFVLSTCAATCTLLTKTQPLRV